MSRFLLVEIHEDLARNDPAHQRFPTTHDMVVLSVALVNGVKNVDDMEVVSADTLTDIMLPKEKSMVKPKRTRVKDAR